MIPSVHAWTKDLWQPTFDNAFNEISSVVINLKFNLEG